MGFLDKLKGAVNMVTGGGAKVTIQFHPQVAFPGETINVQLTATSTGGEVKASAALIDLVATERVSVDSYHVKQSQHNSQDDHTQALNVSKETINLTIPIAPAFTLAANETKIFEGAIQIPPNAQPTYHGHFTHHNWEIRGRIDVFGNDPDSGYVSLFVGKNNA